MTTASDLRTQWGILLQFTKMTISQKATSRNLQCWCQEWVYPLVVTRFGLWTLAELVCTRSRECVLCVCLLQLELKWLFLHSTAFSDKRRDGAIEASPRLRPSCPSDLHRAAPSEEMHAYQRRSKEADSWDVWVYPTVTYSYKQRDETWGQIRELVFLCALTQRCYFKHYFRIFVFVPTAEHNYF